MAKIVVPFTIDEDDVNTLDTAPVTLASISVDDKICVVPVRLEIYRKAGTAYTITRAFNAKGWSEGDVIIPEGNIEVPIPKAPEFIVYDVNTKFYASREDRENVFFRFPMHDFVGTATANGLVAFPVAGLVLRPGNLEVKIEALAGITGGTGDLIGRIFFDEYPVR